MIPKKIHYCWFGGKPLPKLAKKCMDSWKKHLPDYEIKEWNENNFDLDSYIFTREAYDSKKYAFVTDVVRLYALFHEGGIYMDTDVEVIKPLDCFLHHTAFSGFEDETHIPTGILASEQGGELIKKLLEYYDERHFLRKDGAPHTNTNVNIITNILTKEGNFIPNNTLQTVNNYITLYPKEYFCPKNQATRELEITNNTYCIHHFDSSWMPYNERIRQKIKDTKIGYYLGVLYRTLFKR